MSILVGALDFSAVVTVVAVLVAVVALCILAAGEGKTLIPLRGNLPPPDDPYPDIKDLKRWYLNWYRR